MKHAISAIIASTVVVAAGVAACSADTAPSSERLFSAPTITPTAASIRVGDSIRFAMTQPAGAAVTWSVSDTAVATIRQSGWAFARRAGEVMVHGTVATGDRAEAALHIGAAP